MFPKQALSIGINAYTPSYLALQPCINDANDVSNSLKSIGFQVQRAMDPDLNSMKSITHQFVNSIQPGAVAVFYFSGHGVQSDGNNYLIPKNAAGIYAENIQSTAIDAQKLIHAMYQKQPRLIICILDCCRTDPPTRPIDGFGPFRKALAGTKPGFAPMRGPPSTIVVYACAADDAASARSKNGRNSLYTYHLLRHIRTPNVDIETVLRHVALDVQRDSNNKQIPYRIPVSPQHMQTNPVVQLPKKHYRNVAGIHYAQPGFNNFQYQWNGQFGIPINNQLVARKASPNMIRFPLQLRSPFMRQ